MPKSNSIAKVLRTVKLFNFFKYLLIIIHLCLQFGNNMGFL
jgi:hypothetical protein